MDRIHNPSEPTEKTHNPGILFTSRKPRLGRVSAALTYSRAMKSLVTSYFSWPLSGHGPSALVEAPPSSPSLFLFPLYLPPSHSHLRSHPSPATAQSQALAFY